MLLQRIRKTITRYNMLPAGCRVAVAVSGGADSVCLLLALVELASEFDVKLGVAHLNHKLRGQASDEDQEFVEQLAERLKLPFYFAEMTITRQPANLEQAAREARYAFFRGLIESKLTDRVAAGHTRDDQAETVLFRVLRGAGSAGIAGVHPITDSGTVRPLLDVTRAEVEDFLRFRGQVWREDESNREEAFARNRIRNSLLPELRRDWNPQLNSSLAQLADLAFEEEQWWAREMEVQLERLSCPFRRGLEISANAIAHAPKAVARRLVRAVLARVKGDLRGLDFAHVEGVLELAAENDEERTLQVPGTWITRSCGVLWFRESGLPPLAPVTVLTQPGCYQAPDGSRLYIDDGGMGGNTHAAANGATLKSAAVQLRSGDLFDGGSAEAVMLGSEDRELLAQTAKEPLGSETARNQVGMGNALILRGWLAGDRYRPESHSTEQKVKEMFQRARIPSWRRPFWPIVTYRGVIVWAKQFGPAAEFSAQLVPVEQVRVLRIWGSE